VTIAAEHATLDAREASDELRDLARVLRRAIGALVFYWVTVQHLPPQHPYRHAARMVESYLEQRYGV